MNCRKVSRRLSAYIEGNLSPKEISGFEEHLNTGSLLILRVTCRPKKYRDLRNILINVSPVSISWLISS